MTEWVIADGAKNSCVRRLFIIDSSQPFRPRMRIGRISQRTAAGAAVSKTTFGHNRKEHTDMAFYETVFILRQDLTTQQVDDIVRDFKAIATEGKGKILKEENWGLRPLAYKINKNKKGHYILLETDAPSAAIAELERKLGLNENVLRFMTVRLEAPTKGPSSILKEKDSREERRS